MIITPNLKKYLNQPVSNLVQVELPVMEDGQKERQRFYCLLLMAIVHHYWNGNKNGRDGIYPANPADPDAKYLNADYLGHNISALAVDGRGAIIDFEFNHNTIFCNSAEHAEIRLVKRVFSLTQISDSWLVNLEPDNAKYNTFPNVTIYSSLESRSQCSGVMTLAGVDQVVFLQSDPGQYQIGNILRNLTAGTPSDAPLPIPASAFDFPYFTALNELYEQFYQANPVFFIGKNRKEFRTNSITSFLCSKDAYAIYQKATQEFRALNETMISHKDYKPRDRKGEPIDSGLTNLQVLNHCKQFYQYAIKDGRRCTPHKI